MVRFTRSNPSFLFMSKATPPTPPPSGDDRNLVTVDDALGAPSFEERVQQFWQKNSRVIVWSCVAVLLVVVGRTGMDLWEDRQARLLGQEYATAAASEDTLAAFAAAHRGKSLAGVAHLSLADQAYARGDYAAAVERYTAAQTALTDRTFAGRIALGLAISRLKAGETAVGRDALRSLADDLGQKRDVRAEAAYHLASQAAEAGENESLTALVDQLGRIAPGSSWAQRAMMLQMIAQGAAGTPALASDVLPAVTGGDDASDLPTISFDPVP